MPKLPQHVFYAGNPINLKFSPKGLSVFVFDSVKKEFVIDFSYLSRILYDRDNLVQVVDSETFEGRVSDLKLSH